MCSGSSHARSVHGGERWEVTEFFGAHVENVYWCTLCCIIAPARVPKACVTWSQRKNVQMGSMRQRVSLCSDAPLQLATSSEKRGRGGINISLREMEITGKEGFNRFSWRNNPQTNDTGFIHVFIKVLHLASCRLGICTRCHLNTALTACP